MDKDGLKYVGRQLLIVITVAVLALVVFVAGLVVGYTVIGDGKNAMDILSLDKWQEIIAKFTGK